MSAFILCFAEFDTLWMDRVKLNYSLFIETIKSVLMFKS